MVKKNIIITLLFKTNIEDYYKSTTSHLMKNMFGIDYVKARKTGSNECVYHVAPLGQAFVGHGIPRAVPWAIGVCAFGTQSNICAVGLCANIWPLEHNYGHLLA